MSWPCIACPGRRRRRCKWGGGPVCQFAHVYSCKIFYFSKVAKQIPREEIHTRNKQTKLKTTTTKTQKIKKYRWAGKRWVDILGGRRRHQGGGFSAGTHVGLKTKQSKTKHLSALINIHVFSQWKYSFSVTFSPNQHIVFFLVGSVVNFLKIYS